MNSSWGCDITRPMQHPAHVEEILMEEALAAIRRAMADEEAGEMTSTSTLRVAEAGLLSRDATAAIGSAFNTLSETVKQHQPSLEDVVRETLRPMLKSWP